MVCFISLPILVFNFKDKHFVFLLKVLLPKILYASSSNCESSVRNQISIFPGNVLQPCYSIAHKDGH